MYTNTYDDNNNIIRHRNHRTGYKYTQKFNKFNKVVSYKDSNGVWLRNRYSKLGHLLYHIDSTGYEMRYINLRGKYVMKFERRGNKSITYEYNKLGGLITTTSKGI